MNAPNYLPLARKYRPSTFAELCGQGATATALANAIKMGREPHAVIFSGVRGVGKTTSARLYAKALNCKAPVETEPCNECDSCLAINLGNHEDVMEIDGASNTSVDDIRALRETVTYVAQRSRFKVYIIDEVHMLSQSAFNALLKTLEEPPAHVVFVFATTELQKIPQTIMSRCQIFHLQKLSLLTIRERLTKILVTEKIPYDEKAVVAIAREGHGSMRDALTLLDHAIAVGDGVVSTSTLGKIISHVSSSFYLQLLDALVSRNPNSVIEILDRFEDTGIIMKDVAEKTAIMARHAFIVRDVGPETLDFKSIGFDDEECRYLSEIALKSGPTDLNRLFRTLAKASLDLDGSEIDRYILENYSLEWCLDPGILITHKQATYDGSSDKKAQRNPQSERADQTKSLATNNRITVADIRGSLGSKNNISNETIDASKPATLEIPRPILEKKSLEQKTEPTVEPKNSSTQPKSLPETWRKCVEIWKKHNPLQAKKLEDIHPKDYSPQRIELVIPADSFLSSTLLKADEQKKLKDTFAELFGYTNPIIFRAKSTDERIESTFRSELPESLTSIQLKESSSRKEKITTDAKNNPTTQDAIQLFNATIESVEPCLESQD